MLRRFSPNGLDVSKSSCLVAAVLVREDGADELLLVDLAHGVARYAVDDLHDLGDLVVGEAALERAAHLQGSPLLGDGGVEDDDGSDFVAPRAAGHGDDGRLGDLGQGEELALDLEGADLFAAGLDDVGGSAALDEVQGAPGPGLAGRVEAGGRDGAADGDVARLEPAAAAVGVGGGELLLGGGRVAPVLLEDGGAAELDLAGALAALGAELLAGEDDLGGVDVDEAGLDGGQGPADGGVDAVGKGQAAGEGHADLRHAVALEEDVAVAERGPGGFDRGREGGGPGDVEAQVGGGDGLAGGVPDRRGQGLVAVEEPAVDGGDGGEEGDLGLGRPGGGVAVGAPRRWGEERSGEAVPDGVGVEGEHELDGGAGHQRGQDGVDDAVDVVEGEEMEQVVRGRVFPSLVERAGLGGQDGLGEQDAFLESMRPAAPGLAPSSKGTRSLAAAALSACLGSSTWAGLDAKSAAKTCWALDANLGDETSREASLWFSTYSSSGTGNAGDRGTAMERAARMARRATADQAAPRSANITKELAVGETPTGERVDHGEGIGIVPSHGFEYGQTRQGEGGGGSGSGGGRRRRHPHASGCGGW
ncbi:hypothetical protein Trco_002276 [Trichoderma cornu-damae]|uniref:Uncharacterized protein n=1 Tax=Trichoderma cornu-damae TaxID=654480 RepID=A0A9P8QMB5_9HYPO|nr:hypothetical protein Trco_002276 [Trichoderma cornu-damae]